MIRKGIILLRIEHFQKRRRRITAEVRREFIHFIEEKDGIFRSRLLHSRHDTAG